MLDSNLLPKIIIKHQVYSKIRAYADLCHDEISALGTVKVFDNVVYIEDVFLFNQTVTPSTTEINQTDLAKFMYECIKKGGDPSSLKFWWHSHVNMEVFWSSTDSYTIEKFSKEWMVSIVSNKRDDFKVRLDIFSPIRICFDNLPYTIEYDKINCEQIKAEIAAKVHGPFFNGGVSNFFNGGSSNENQRLFTSAPSSEGFMPSIGDPKTVVMTEYRPLLKPKPIPKYNSPANKSWITKILEFFVVEPRSKSIRNDNSPKTVPPRGNSTPAAPVSKPSDVPSDVPLTEVSKSVEIKKS
jgi:hypothetical protein